MFTQRLMEKMEMPFEEQLKRMGAGADCAKKAGRIADLTERNRETDVSEALKCLYASMPVSDAVDYPVALFEAYARHGAFLWRKGPFAGRVPEGLFAAYVLYHRVNNEDLTEYGTETFHGRLFYEELKDRIAGLDMRQAALKANYWCASQATYRPTDGRTASPMCVYRSAYGRCGEESTFTASVLRSIGIPARQLYVPLWSHCDDNHAWVEAWCDGEWAFLGGCEPEEVLNKGWFNAASSRAMLVHSKLPLPLAECRTEEGGREAGEKREAAQTLAGNDMCLVLNHTDRYALTTEQRVSVCDKAGAPQPDALVRFEVMNGACFGEIASVRTDEDGRCTLRLGLGSVHVTASKGGAYGERLIDTREGKCCGIVLDGTAQRPEQWEELTISAPKDSAVNRVDLTGQEKRRGRERLEEAGRLRQEKEGLFFDEALAGLVTERLDQGERDRCMDIMKRACGNQREIADFLGKPAAGAYPERWKIALLESLREKDYRDITAEILEENCRETAVWEGAYADPVLVPYVLCPRVGNEMIRPFRRFIRSWLEQESHRRGRNLEEEIRRDPALAWQLVKEQITWDEKAGYGNLVSSAAGALDSGWGSRLTQRTVCVQVLRTVGVPARLNPAEGMPEAWWHGEFVLLERRERNCIIHVSGQEGVEWEYSGNWTLSCFDQGAYRPLRLGFGDSGQLTGPIAAFPGKYKALTANRLPNGDILAKQLCFALEEGQEREIRLELAQAKPWDMLTEYDIADFVLKRENGEHCLVSDLVREREGLFVWLGEDQETEQLLNGIHERREAYAGSRAGLFIVAAGPQILRNPACGRLLQALPKIEMLYGDFGADMEALARRLYLEPGKLPLTVLIDRDMRGIYRASGYSRSAGDMVLELIRQQSK